MTSMIDTSESKPVSQQVIAEVAETTNTDPLNLEPLYTRVDPDCLNSIFSDETRFGGRDLGKISFPLAGCQVVVEADGTIDVTEQSTDTKTSERPEQAPTVSDMAESPD